ncbi:mechanosensitive ion channel family protein [Flavobacterium faecale]|uniref:mechanosensitive ion channel family protein n=1 Tax=Flavobacterium faecale TaxID=1355330 RepID=UPI003AAAD9EF
MIIVAQIQKDAFVTLNSLFDRMGEGLMNFLFALLVLLIGWVIATVVHYLLEKALKIANIDKLTAKLTSLELFGKSNIKFSVSNIILGFVRWILMLIFLIIAADVMKWNVISIEISNLLRYLPKLFSALVLLMIGLYIANFVRKAIYALFNSLDFSGAKIISSLVFYGIVALVAITALNQAGVDTGLITSNITLIFGAFLLTFALAFGLGSKEVIQGLLLTFYARKNYTVGDVIKLKTMEGQIVAIDNVSMTLKTETGKFIIPIKEVVENIVEVKKA